MDKTVNKINIQSTNTHKQEKRLPDSLLTDKIKTTKAYTKYDEAFKAGRVNFSQFEEEPSQVKTRSREEARQEIHATLLQGKNLHLLRLGEDMYLRPLSNLNLHLKSQHNRTLK